MTYNTNIPSEEDSPAISQPDIKTNFFEYDRIFSINHVDMNDDNEGNHAHVHFKNQSTVPAVNPPKGTVYGKIGTGVANAPNLFFRTSKFLPNVENDPEQLTFQVATIVGAQQQSFMMGGYIVYFGTAPTPLVGVNVITFAFGAIPASSKTVFIATQYAGFTKVVDSYTTSTFTVTVPFATSIDYFIIGKM